MTAPQGQPGPLRAAHSKAFRGWERHWFLACWKGASQAAARSTGHSQIPLWAPPYVQAVLGSLQWPPPADPAGEEESKLDVDRPWTFPCLQQAPRECFPFHPSSTWEKGLPWWLRWWRIHLQCRRPGLNPWVRKIPWRRARQPTPVFLPGEFHGLRSLVGYGLLGCKESDTTEQLTHTHTYLGKKLTSHRRPEAFMKESNGLRHSHHPRLLKICSWEAESLNHPINPKRWNMMETLMTWQPRCSLSALVITSRTDE